MAQLFSTALLTGNPLSLDAAEFAFVGKLYVRGDDAWLEFDQPEEGRLDIADPSFVDRMWRGVPSRLGGEFLFADPVEFVGALTVKGGKLVIGAVGHGKLFQAVDGQDGKLDAYDF